MAEETGGTSSAGVSATLGLGLDTSPALSALNEFQVAAATTFDTLSKVTIKPGIDETHFQAQVDKLLKNRKDDSESGFLVKLRLQPGAANKLADDLRLHLSSNPFNIAINDGKLREDARLALSKLTVGINTLQLSEQIRMAAQAGLRNLFARVTTGDSLVDKTASQPTQVERIVSKEVVINPGNAFDDLQNQFQTRPLTVLINQTGLITDIHAAFNLAVEKKLNAEVNREHLTADIYEGLHEGVRLAIGGALKGHNIELDAEALDNFSQNIRTAARKGISGLSKYIQGLHDKAAEILSLIHI